MAIAFEKYVSITSGVVGNRGVRQRELIGRIFTASALVSPDEVLEFTSLDDIRAFFGADSEETLRAQFYFAWVSKQATRAKKLSFARYSDTAIAPAVFGGTSAKHLNDYLGNGDGIGITLAGATYSTGYIDLSEAASLTDVASLLTTAIAAADDALSGASVSFDAASRRFILTVSGTTGLTHISIDDNTLAEKLEWTRSTGAIFISGADARSPADTVAAAAEITNNFGSFLFQAALSDADIAAVAAWNHAQNVKYMYCAPVDSLAGAQAQYAALSGYSGTAITLRAEDDFAEMAPMVILAATDYDRRNSTCNYMFQEFPTLTASVDKTSNAAAFDAVRCNYNGVTQTTGQYLAFYQRGLLMGGSTAPVDMNTYANEAWLKDLAGSQIMSLLLSLQKVSANDRGRAKIINTLLPVIDTALYNGTISVGRTLLPTQKAFITEETGDPDAWQQVQNKGYWLSCAIRTEVTTDGRTEYYAGYILIYAKDDVIRCVEGSHELI
ncbi:MAG: DUF3383 domain-containing protein [Azoarcus sp.]|jgi:hypothetical protein|nr:DUF3383 domain-containing protein [Azoarcus sp.]